MGEVIGPIVGGSVSEVYGFDSCCILISLINFLFGILFLSVNYKFIANFYYGNEVERQLKYVEISEYQSLRNISLRNMSKTGIVGSLNEMDFDVSLVYVSRKRRANYGPKSHRHNSPVKECLLSKE